MAWLRTERGVVNGLPASFVSTRVNGSVAPAGEAIDSAASAMAVAILLTSPPFFAPRVKRG